jgi:hypothetical protein
MSQTNTWTSGSANPDNEANLAQISQWWRSLNGQRILWKQRPIPDSGLASEINWETTEQFDEQFLPNSADLRGITLFWRKNTPSLVSQPEEERSLTPNSLEFDPFAQHLYINSGSGRNYQIRVTLPQVVYKTLTLDNPQITSLVRPSGEVVILLRDLDQKLEIRVDLSLLNRQSLQEKLN